MDKSKDNVSGAFVSYRRWSRVSAKDERVGQHAARGAHCHPGTHRVGTQQLLHTGLVKTARCDTSITSSRITTTTAAAAASDMRIAYRGKSSPLRGVLFALSALVYDFCPNRFLFTTLIILVRYCATFRSHVCHGLREHIPARGRCDLRVRVLVHIPARSGHGHAAADPLENVHDRPSGEVAKVDIGKQRLQRRKRKKVQ